MVVFYVKKKPLKIMRRLLITDNGSVDSVLMGYEIFEQLYDRLTQLEQQEEERILVERIESLDRDPASAKSWKDIRRTT